MELSNQGSKEEPARWASVALARPVRIQYKGYFSILNGCLFVLLGGLCAGIIAANGLNPVSLLVVTLNVLFLLGFLFIQARARKKLAILFEASGVTRGDGRQRHWNEFKGVDYRLVSLRRNPAGRPSGAPGVERRTDGRYSDQPLRYGVSRWRPTSSRCPAGRSSCSTSINTPN